MTDLTDSQVDLLYMLRFTEDGVADLRASGKSFNTIWAEYYSMVSQPPYNISVLQINKPIRSIYKLDGEELLTDEQFQRIAIDVYTKLLPNHVRGGKKPRKHKSRRHKSRRHKSRRHKSRRHKSRRHN